MSRSYIPLPQSASVTCSWTALAFNFLKPLLFRYQADESTDIAGHSVLLAIVRYINNNKF
jgi:hypothetical protein